MFYRRTKPTASHSDRFAFDGRGRDNQWIEVKRASGPVCTFWNTEQILTPNGNQTYSSPNIVRVIKSRRMRWAGHVARMGEERGPYRVLVGKPEGKRPLGRPRRIWVDNIRMNLQKVGFGHVDWIGVAQDRDGWFHKMRGIS